MYRGEKKEVLYHVYTHAQYSTVQRRAALRWQRRSISCAVSRGCKMQLCVDDSNKRNGSNIQLNVVCAVNIQLCVFKNETHYFQRIEILYIVMLKCDMNTDLYMIISAVAKYTYDVSGYIYTSYYLSLILCQKIG